MNKLIFYIFLILTFIECKEPYDFDSSPNDGLLIVDGGLSDQPGPYFISLGTTSNAKRRPEPLTDAKLYVTDGNDIEYFTEYSGGKYRLEGSIIRAQAGRRYTLKIILSDGRRYASTQEALPESDAISDSLYTAIQQEKRLNGSEQKEVISWRVNAKLDVNLPKTKSKSYYRWSLAEVFSVFPTCFPGAISCPPICYVSENNNYNLTLIDPNNYSELKISNIVILDREIDFSFDTRHYFITTQHVINKGAFDYWIKVQDLVTKKGSIFDTPPYTIIGNISNENDPSESVFGFFEVSRQKILRAYVDRGQIPVPIQTCQYYSPDFIYSNIPSYCFNCLQLEGSTIEEPTWFW